MYRVEMTLTSVMPLIMHHDDIEGADDVQEWRRRPENKDSAKGDDRCPPWTWVTYMSTDEHAKVVVPMEALHRCLIIGAKQFKLGRGNASKRIASGLRFMSLGWPLMVGGKQVDADPFQAMRIEDASFAEYKAAAKAAGFSLLMKRATVGTSKHVRVRPIFHSWSLKGEVVVTDGGITFDALKTITELAGQFSGLGDWRPSAPKSPGPYGTFAAELKRLKG